MTKHIFTSQSNLELGRNRSQRRLEAQLDSQQVIKDDNQSIMSQHSSVALADTHLSLNLPDISFCKYLGSCPITTRKKCMFNFGYEGCNVYKFYERWGRWTKKLK